MPPLRGPAEVARQLDLRGGDSLVQVRRVLSFSGTPAILEDIWLPGTPFKGLSLETLSSDKGPMYALFEAQFGVRMVRAVEKLKAVAADADAAVLLGVEVGHPLLSVERLRIHVQRRADGVAPRPLPHGNQALPQRTELSRRPVTDHAVMVRCQPPVCCVAIEFEGL